MSGRSSLYLTMGAIKAGQAVALVVVDKVNAGAAILARIDRAVINVGLAVLAGKSGRTQTGIPILVTH